MSHSSVKRLSNTCTAGMMPLLSPAKGVPTNPRLAARVRISPYLGET